MVIIADDVMTTTMSGPFLAILASHQPGGKGDIQNGLAHLTWSTGTPTCCLWLRLSRKPTLFTKLLSCRPSQFTSQSRVMSVGEATAGESWCASQSSRPGRWVPSPGDTQRLGPWSFPFFGKGEAWGVGWSRSR